MTREVHLPAGHACSQCNSAGSAPIAWPPLHHLPPPLPLPLPLPQMDDALGHVSLSLNCMQPGEFKMQMRDSGNKLMENTWIKVR